MWSKPPVRDFSLASGRTAFLQTLQGVPYALREIVIMQRAIFFLQMTAETMLRPWFFAFWGQEVWPKEERFLASAASCLQWCRQDSSSGEVSSAPHMASQSSLKYGMMVTCSLPPTANWSCIWWKGDKSLHKWLSSDEDKTTHYELSYLPIFSIEVAVGVWLFCFSR